MALLLAAVSGCAPAVASAVAIPVTGAAPGLQVREYMLVEESTDNPTRAEFQQRVPAAVAAQRHGLSLLGSQNTVSQPNQVLAEFGFRLEPNTSPPFSGYSLYQNGYLVQRDIARFWPVSIENNGRQDFLLPFTTLSGAKLVASLSGVHPWPNQDAATERSSGPLALAQTGNGLPGADGVTEAQAGTSLPVLSGASQPASEPGGIPAGEYAFGEQMIGGQPLYFHAENGLVHIYYAGKELAYTYDAVVHAQSGPLAIYNPASDGNIAWFYALRDGLWYYVEAGIFQ